MRSDKGDEYHYTALQECFCNCEVNRQLANASSSHKNRVAKRINWTLLDFVRSMLQHQRLAKIFWEEALSTATYAGSRVTSHALSVDKTCPRIWKGFTPGFSHPRVSGSHYWYATSRSTMKELGKQRRPV